MQGIELSHVDVGNGTLSRRNVLRGGLIAAAAVILALNVSWDGTPLFSHPAFSIVRDNFPDLRSWLLLGAALLASFFLKIKPIALIVAGGILGFLLY